MKRLAVGLLVLTVWGCQIGSDTFEQWVRDPQFTEYEQKLDTLEKSYLRKEMTYAEYSAEKKKLDEQYEKTIKSRQEKIENYP